MDDLVFENDLSSAFIEFSVKDRQVVITLNDDEKEISMPIMSDEITQTIEWMRRAKNSGKSNWGTGQRSQTIKDLDFHLTCIAYPEQYYVFRGDEYVGYVKLRHGYLFARLCPSEQEVWNSHADVGRGERHLQGDGMFDDDDERTHFLTLIADAINKDLETNHE